MAVIIWCVYDNSYNIIAPVNTVTYICTDGKTLTASFYKGKDKPIKKDEMPVPSGSLKLIFSDGRKMDLSQTISADGARYANNDESFVFWIKGNGARIYENNDVSSSQCIVLSNDPGGLSGSYCDKHALFSVRYPENYIIDTSYQYQALGPGKEISGVKFTIPPEIAKGTNLSGFDTGISIELIEGVTDCNTSLFLDGSQNSKIVNDKNREYLFSTRTEGAAGNIYEEQVWIIQGTNPCLAVRYFIHSMNIHNYPEDTVKEFNRAVLMKQFDKIRRSLITL